MPFRKQTIALLKDLLTTAEVAAVVGVSPRTLEDWRYRDEGQGPPFRVLSPRCVRYSAVEVQAWISTRPRVIRRKRKAAGALAGQLSLIGKEVPLGPAPPPARPCWWAKTEEGNC